MNTTPLMTHHSRPCDGTTAIKPKHKEGFALMEYTCKQCGKVETIWNSRDGVTPFSVGCAECKGTMNHTHFEGDRSAPEHNPKPGSRFFRDGTAEDALQCTKRHIALSKKNNSKIPEETQREMLAEAKNSTGPWEKGWPTLDTVKTEKSAHERYMEYAKEMFKIFSTMKWWRSSKEDKQAMINSEISGLAQMQDQVFMHGIRTGAEAAAKQAKDMILQGQTKYVLPVGASVNDLITVIKTMLPAQFVEGGNRTQAYWHAVRSLDFLHRCKNMVRTGFEDGMPVYTKAKSIPSFNKKKKLKRKQR